MVADQPLHGPMICDSVKEGIPEAGHLSFGFPGTSCAVADTHTHWAGVAGH